MDMGGGKSLHLFVLVLEYVLASKVSPEFPILIFVTEQNSTVPTTQKKESSSPEYPETSKGQEQWILLGDSVWRVMKKRVATKG